MEAYFSPHGGICDRIVELIGSARESVKVLAYTFTERAIADAFIAKASLVTLIQDAGGARGLGSLIADVSSAGAKCYVDHKHAIAHNKVIVIDGSILVTGSYNFTTAAEHSNAENIIVIKDRRIAAKYEEDFAVHLAHSVPYSEAEVGESTGDADAEQTQR